ncbi:MAG TPA: 2OG-Fe(II) oxygenase [Allosphingosinicella sp.]|jgi:prolyl 4-hydroxylase|uniref:2OG-Fe(II) oxygenase n=1 Tax=Allosphingosinicella sp. TaxID=2823234 RepID=UPI002F27ACB5
MSILNQARALAQSGRGSEARTLVQSAAERGDTEALLAVAHWRLHGLYGPRDLADSHRLLDRARQAGSTEATLLLATLVGNGTGVAADYEKARALLASIAPQDADAAAQLALLDRMQQLDCLEQLPAERLSDDPAVRLVRGLISLDECSYLISRAAPLLQPSVIIDPSGRRLPHPTRTSAGMSFGPLEEDLVVNALNRRIAAITGTQPSWGEPLHVLRYAPGQEYKPHVDALPGVENQRRWTALLYLNNEYEAGETDFDQLGIVARGEPGDALIFANAADDGRPDYRTRHAGRPVASGTKWLATRWIRQAPYDPWTGR